MTNVDDQVTSTSDDYTLQDIHDITLKSLDSVLAGAIDLEAKKENVKSKYMELLTRALNVTRFSKFELNKVMVSAYQEACKPLPTSASNTPSDPHPAPSSDIAIGHTEVVNDNNGVETGEYIEGLDELENMFGPYKLDHSATDSVESTTLISSPLSPPWNGSGPCQAGLYCRGFNKCPCPSPSSPADLAGRQAQPCSAGRWCKGKCPCRKKVTFLGDRTFEAA